MRHGQVSWCEVTGKSGEALQGFYGELFGWEFQPAPKMPDYGMVLRQDPADGPGTGVSPASEGPGWMTFYVQVDDLEATMAEAEARGGAVVVSPMAIENGRVALIRDPEGHVVGLSAV